MSNFSRHVLIPAEPFIGSVFAIGILILLACSLYFNLFIAAAAMFSMLFIATVAYFSTNHIDVAVRLVALLNIVFLMLYYPTFGFVLGGVPSFDVSFLKIIVGIRPILVFFGLCVIALFFSIRRVALLWPLAIVLMLSLSFVHSDSSLEARLAYLVNTFAPLFLCLYLAGSRIDVSLRSSNFYIILFAFSLVLMFIYGALINNFFYDIFRPDLIYAIRARDLQPLEYGQIPGPWWSQIEGYSFVRFVGGFPDPIIAGYFFGILVVIAFCQRAYICASLAAIALLLTVSKGAWIFTANVFVIAFFLNKRHIFLWLVLCGLIAMQLFMAVNLDSSAYIHYKGLEGGVLSALSSPLSSIIGFGLGSGGNLESVVSNETFSRAAWLARGAESGVGTVVYQMGFAGLVFWLLLLKRLWLNVRGGNRDTGGDFALAMWLSLFINAFLQENAINSSVLMIVLLGQFLVKSNLPSARLS